MEHEVCVDLESVTGAISGNQEGILDHGLNENQPKPVLTKLSDHILSLDGHLVKNEGSQEMDGKEKRKKSLSAKKPPKPPRPHRGFSLDAADEKFIKELAQLAMIKRARIERMKALMQKKATKASSSSTNGSLFAMMFTIICFIVILFQGVSCQISCGTFTGSPPTLEPNESGFIFIQEDLNPSAHDSV
ncbi:hypothetical protein CTI12_AA327990 [Artemisia annua]|uniref:Transmembrane protein n=1 Tax=Artemisia annua TaxID=35608 RepID=A0A2U1MXC5_ARTAN|nr:hypothetical protein CTI12_AA327990 [Artemisia annua]